MQLRVKVTNIKWRSQSLSGISEYEVFPLECSFGDDIEELVESLLTSIFKEPPVSFDYSIVK
jgi:hypothetical protein